MTLDVAVYRTESKMDAVEAVESEFSVPIYCQVQEFFLPGSPSNDPRYGSGDTWTLYLEEPRSILVVADFTVRVTQEPLVPMHSGISGAVRPNHPLGGGGFHGPWTYNNDVLALPGFATYTAVFPWSTVLARDEGELSLTPEVEVFNYYPETPSDSGIIEEVQVIVRMSVVLGSMSYDECVEWGTSA